MLVKENIMIYSSIIMIFIVVLINVYSNIGSTEAS